MKTICLFNHKGGVSKTTTTFNLGWMLANKGHRVVMVDLDSQCNLTGLVFGYQRSENGLDAFYANRDYITMKPIVDKVIDGNTVENILDSEKGKLLQTKNENLLLLPGHLDVSDLDSQISVALKVSSGIPATKKLIGNLIQVLKTIALNNKAEYLLFDLSPNVGGLNEVVLMSSDYFVIPASPDYFCLQAISSLAKNISKWKKEIQRFKEDNDYNLDSYPIHNEPKLLGVIQQRYRPKNGNPASSFQIWIDKIRLAVTSTLIPALKKIDCVIDDDKIKSVLKNTNIEPYDLAYISDFNSLIAISQICMKPVFELSQTDIKDNSKIFGQSLKIMLENVEKFNIEFKNLSDRIEQLTN